MPHAVITITDNEDGTLNIDLKCFPPQKTVGLDRNPAHRLAAFITDAIQRNAGPIGRKITTTTDAAIAPQKG